MWCRIKCRTKLTKSNSCTYITLAVKPPTLAARADTTPLQQLLRRLVPLLPLHLPSFILFPCSVRIVCMPRLPIHTVLLGFVAGFYEDNMILPSLWQTTGQRVKQLLKFYGFSHLSSSCSYVTHRSSVPSSIANSSTQVL